MKKVFATASLLVALGVSAIAQVPCWPIRVTVAEPDRVLTDLTEKDFTLKIGSTLVPVQSAKISPGRRFAVVLDASGSMRDPSKSGGTERRTWSLLLEALNRVVDATPKQYSLALVTFSDKVEPLVPLTDERRLIHEALKREWQDTRPPSGMTSLWDALHWAVEMLTPAQDGDFILVITDGADNASKANIRGIQAELAARRIRLFPVMALQYVARTQEERDGPVNMQEVAEHTGGMAVSFVPWRWVDRSPAEKGAFLTSLARSIVALSTYSYALDTQIPSFKKKDRVKIELVRDQSKRRKVKLLYQPSIGPCTSGAHQP